MYQSSVKMGIAGQVRSKLSMRGEDEMLSEGNLELQTDNLINVDTRSKLGRVDRLPGVANVLSVKLLFKASVAIGHDK